MKKECELCGENVGYILKQGNKYIYVCGEKSEEDDYL